ncbi:MAG: type II secretion system protein [bacterium]|nr:type II secretion system protein [bacterium]
MKNKKGFTLVELIAVIVILALISTIAVVSVTRYKQRAIEDEKVTLRQNVISTFGIYRIDNGTYVNTPVPIDNFNATFTFNGERCETVDGNIKFIYADGSQKEIYCVRLVCNGEEVINDYLTNSLCND